MFGGTGKFDKGFMKSERFVIQKVGFLFIDFKIIFSVWFRQQVLSLSGGALHQCSCISGCGERLQLGSVTYVFAG